MTENSRLDNWIARIAFVLSLIAILQTCNQNARESRLAQEHIEPQISARFDDPPNSNPIVVFTNSGDISAYSFSVRSSAYFYNKSTKNIDLLTGSSHGFSNASIFNAELKPQTFEKQEQMGYSQTQGFVHVYVFDLKWFRGTDMQEFPRRDMFFIDEGEVLDHQTFQKKPYYKEVMEKVEAAKMPKFAPQPGSVKEMADILEGAKQDQKSAD